MKLNVVRLFDPWRSSLCTCPRKYSLHPYTGCSHFCLYCYATSYIGRKPSTPKVKFLERVKGDLEFIEKDAIIEMSSSSDPYPPIEEKLKLTRKTLELLLMRDVRVLITTKSHIVTRDIDLLRKIPSAIMITITTLDDSLAKLIEPEAPPPSLRLKAIRELNVSNIPVGVRVDPIIPSVNDDPYLIAELIEVVKEAGARHIVTATYKAKWDSLSRLSQAIPEIAGKLRELYVHSGVKIHGYMYLTRNKREELLLPVVKTAIKLGLTVATCREGLNSQYFQAPSCDGSHLISLSPRSKININRS
ncbi:MAG: radical SAM protein [Desulfurococcaceae archaeon]|nr:radical SAM protein [Desulfurococcaceae archaeon]